MTIEKADHAREKGVALVYVGIFLVPLLLCTGLAVDLGWGYLVRATLAKAVDAAALAAARNIAADPSQAKRAGNNIFNANFPAGYLGVSPEQPDIETDVGPDGSYIIHASSKATMPTTFMRVAKFDSLTVAASAQATRRLVDMSFVIDRSGSLIGHGAFPVVKQAAKQFVSYFKPTADRIALITFSDNTVVEDAMWSARGFDPGSIDGHIDLASPGGATATAEALYKAWNELRTVPSGSQSGLRIVVLFTDGSPNALPGEFKVMSPASTGSGCTSTPWRDVVPGTVFTLDYPHVSGNSTTYDEPGDYGLVDTDGPKSLGPVPPTTWNTYTSGQNRSREKINKCIPNLPLRSSRGDLYDASLHQRFLVGGSANGYPNHVRNANNAARNLAESIANGIRSDTDGASRIRIYTLGLGDLLDAEMGERPETGASILRRIANDPVSPDYRSDQPAGKYFFAGDPAELNAAFQAVRDQIVRLTE